MILLLAEVVGGGDAAAACIPGQLEGLRTGYMASAPAHYVCVKLVLVCAG